MSEAGTIKSKPKLNTGLRREIAAAAVIYGLFDGEGRLRYIGKANDPQARLKSHLRDARRRRTPLYDWIRKRGTPEMRILEAGPADWKEAERRLIREARANGESLLNLADGGDEPYCAPGVRTANAAAVNGNPIHFARRTLLRRLALAAKERGNVGRSASDRWRAVQSAIAAMPPEDLAYRMSHFSWGVKCFPAWCQPELEALNASV